MRTFSIVQSYACIRTSCARSSTWQNDLVLFHLNALTVQIPCRDERRRRYSLARRDARAVTARRCFARRSRPPGRGHVRAPVLRPRRTISAWRAHTPDGPVHRAQERPLGLRACALRLGGTQLTSGRLPCTGAPHGAARLPASPCRTLMGVRVPLHTRGALLYAVTSSPLD